MTQGLRQGSTHGWAHVSLERKREMIDAVVAGKATRGPVHAELDLTDRCNVACYFCNQQDTRTALQIPVEKAMALIDQLAERGLRSVRLSGGGDPLHHKEIVPLLDHLARRKVVVDNLTTNGASLTPAVVQRLVDHRAREVNISLNAVDGADYHRMMQVKPAIFDRVLANVRHLLAERGDRSMPVVTVQFLLDRANAHRVLEMDEVARALGCDRTVVSCVQQIPLARVEDSILLDATDAPGLEESFVELFRRHRDRPEALEVNLEYRGLGPMVAEARRRAQVSVPVQFPVAPSFRDEDGACFFAWYSTTITGNGDVYPCCQVIQPGGPVLGNVLQQDVEEVWHGERYEQVRAEMRDVLVAGADRPPPRERFKILPPVCTDFGVCWLKNIYFIGDDAFYRELSAALAGVRADRDRIRRLREAARSALDRAPWLAPLYHRLRNASRPTRRWLKRHLRVGLTEAG